MKVVIIGGSPRIHGNSDLLCDEFCKGAREAGHHVEKIVLAKLNIHPCQACYVCFQTGKCYQHDDMDQILKKVENADVLVLATPTYFLTMSGQMKVFIDRLLPKWQNLGGKKVYLIVTGHDSQPGLQRTGDDLKAIVESLQSKVQKIIWGEKVWKKGEVLFTKAMSEAYQAGKNIT